MNLRRKDLVEVLSDATYGIAQSGNTYGASLASELLIAPGQMLYMRIPHQELRNFTDNLFPELAKNPIADCAKGWGHRYKAGHDLLLDVPSTAVNHGPIAGLKHAGHILLTDFPTKAGIPIPGFSHSGLGQLLEECGIQKAWMSLNISDAGFGMLAVADGSSDLLAAMQGHLSMGLGTAIETFGTGTAELGLAIATGNPLMAIAALEEYLAGLISTWKTFSVYVDPLDFFGAAGMSTLMGFGVAYGLVGENLSDATRDAIRSGIIGALYSVSTAFGYGALAGLLAYRLSTALAKHHNHQVQSRLTIDEHSYRLLVDALCSGNADFANILARTVLCGIPSDAFILSHKPSQLESSSKPLSTTSRLLNDHAITLNAKLKKLSNKVISLPDDPDSLSDIYRTMLSSLTL